MGEDQNFRSLLIKYQQGQATEEEIAFLESRYIQWNAGKHRDLSEEFFKSSERVMWENISARTQIQTSAKKISLWIKLTGIAAILAIIFSVAFWISYKKSAFSGSDPAVSQKIIPGMQGATLMLANGEKVRLNDLAPGQVAAQAGVEIVKYADGRIVYVPKSAGVEVNQVNILSTARGETFHFQLPDGSKVYLNAASSIKFSPSLLIGSKRMVELDGEGYFEVAKDKLHPFVVKAKGQAVEVLGTSFNINAYQEQPSIKTTLVEGKVKLSNGRDNRTMLPGEEALVNVNGISISNVDVSFAVAWKNNKFIFDGKDIRSIMKMLERWYNVEVIYKGEMPTEALYGTVSRFDDISQVLRILESVGGFQFQVIGRKIYVSDKKAGS